MKTANVLPFLFTFTLCLFTFYLFSQSNINQTLSINSSGAAADASAMLDVSATDKGMLVPRMTTAQRTAIATPATGLLVFDSTTGSFWFYNGTSWVNLSTPKVLADADGDTKIQVEESPDEDIIRFDLGGTQEMVLRKNASGEPRLELFGNDNTFVGFNTGSANTSGNFNTAIGSSALFSNTMGTFNTAGGLRVLYSNTTGFDNTAFGADALFSNMTGSSNAAFGKFALHDNSTGIANTAVGVAALTHNTTGGSNAAIGVGALDFNTTGSFNAATGYFALYSNTTGYSNVATGIRALYLNTERSNLVAVGDSTLFNNGNGATLATHGAGNVALGSKALFSNTTGSYNTASGYNALNDNTTGNSNTANGYQSLPSTTTGVFNSGFGYRSLYSNTTGSNNTGLGYNAYFTANNLTNTTCLGYGSGGVSNVNNRIEIGNTSISWIGGEVAWGTYSDARIKTQVQENVPGLAFITKLRPVTYHLDIHKQNELCGLDKKDGGGWEGKYDIEQKQFTGFIAQEVEQAAKTVGYDFSGVEKAADEVGMYSVRYSDFVMPLVKGMQEQQALIEQQSAKLAHLEAENLTLKTRLETQAAQLEKITAALQGMGVALK